MKVFSSYFVLKIFIDHIFCLVFYFQRLNCLFHLLHLRIFQLAVLLDLTNLARAAGEILDSRLTRIGNTKAHYETFVLFFIDIHTNCLYLNISLMSICLLAGPSSIPLTLLAKLREQSVSPTSSSFGLICTNIKVFESPPEFIYLVK